MKTLIILVFLALSFTRQGHAEGMTFDCEFSAIDSNNLSQMHIEVSEKGVSSSRNGKLTEYKNEKFWGDKLELYFSISQDRIEWGEKEDRGSATELRRRELNTSIGEYIYTIKDGSLPIKVIEKGRCIKK